MYIDYLFILPCRKLYDLKVFKLKYAVNKKKLFYQNTLLMDRKSGESNEIRALHDKIAQLNQHIDKLETDKVFCIGCILILNFTMLHFESFQSRTHSS